MRSNSIAVVALILAAAFAGGCSSSPEQLVAKHTKRGDEYMVKDMYKEAVIEYMNAVRIGPNDGALHYKLAKAALEARDIGTGYQELLKTVELLPDNHEALGKLGSLYLTVGKIEEADAVADNLVRMRPGDPQGYILKSGVAVRGGRIDAAIAHLRKAVELDPGKSRPIVTLGNLYLIKRDRKSALESYDRAIAVEPKAPEPHLARGNYFFASGESDEGEKEYKLAISLSNRKEELLIALAEHYLFQGRLKESEAKLEAVIREMNSQKARKALAEIKLETGRIDEAKRIVDSILKVNEKDMEGKYLKGRIALAEKRIDDAKALFGDVVNQDAGMARARLYNGLTDILQGHMETGKKEVVEAVRLDPGNNRARLVLGEMQLKSGLPAEAEKEAVEVLRRNPSNLQAALILGDSFLMRKDWRKAEQVYGSIIRQMPESPAGYFKMGLSKMSQKKPAEAAGFFSKALARNPKDLLAVNEYIFACASSGQADKARKTLEDYKAKEPKNPHVWEMAGRFEIASGRQKDAESAFLKAIELAPDFTRPYYELGVMYAGQKKLSEAEVKFRKVIEKNEKDVGTRVLLGIVLNNQGKLDEANAQYRRALELLPRNPLAANNLAANLSDHGGNLDEALKFAQNARGMMPEDPNIADTLGWIYYKKGLYDTAYPLIADAARKLEKSAVVRYHHGMVLSKRGKQKEAVAELKQALALDPKFHGAEEARKVVAGQAK